MAIGGKGPPRKPGASIRGSFVVDTVRGAPRVRPWPKSNPLKPGSAREYSARYFAAMNRMCKAWHPAFAEEARRVTAGTPYYPRDILLMGMYGRSLAVVMPNKQQWWSMANRATVSASLDVLGSLEGSRLRRGPDFWEAIPDVSNVDQVLLYISATRSNQNYTTLQALNWDEKLYGAAHWWDKPTSASKVIVPVGVTLIEVRAQIALTNVAANGQFYMYVMKNGSNEYPGAGRTMAQFSAAPRWLNVHTPPIPVVQGDEIQLSVQTANATAVTLIHNSSWLLVRNVT